MSVLSLGKAKPRQELQTGRVILGPFSESASVLRLTIDEWKALVAAVKSGELDRLSFE